MARQGNLNMDGAVRVHQELANVAYIGESNNGAFVAPPVHNGIGDTTINLAADHGLAAGDLVEAQNEDVLSKAIAVERVSATQIRIRCYGSPSGTPTTADFSLSIVRRFCG
jgi:hypothetical protein